MVAKAEHLAKGANPRFVVTSLTAGEIDARTLYEEDYCGRGEMENRIKEQQLHLFADRTTAATMRANQIRLFFSSIAYVLLEALRRLGLRHTQFATATCGTIRLKLLKIGAQVRNSVRRIKVAMASACPYQAEYHLAYLYLAAPPPSEHAGIQRPRPHRAGRRRTAKMLCHQRKRAPIRDRAIPSRPRPPNCQSHLPAVRNPGWLVSPSCE